MTEKRIALVGFMASGKSTVGALLAKRTGSDFVDLDEYIETMTGERIPDIFQRLGEPQFRAYEVHALGQLAVRAGGVVLATGGGAVTSAANRQQLVEQWQTIYLRARPETIEARLRADGTPRPLLAVADPSARIRELLEARAAWYNQVAKYLVDVDELTVDEIVDQLLLRLQSECEEGL